MTVPSWVHMADVPPDTDEERRAAAVRFLGARIDHFHECRECNDAGWVGACGWEDPEPEPVRKLPRWAGLAFALVLIAALFLLALVVKGVPR